MALTPQEKAEVEQLHSRGYSTEEIQRHIGAKRAGRSSAIDKNQEQISEATETAKSSKGFWDKAGRFLLSDEAINQLGRGFAYGPLGGMMKVTTVNEETGELEKVPVREFLAPPERKKLGGALLQTGALIGDVALAPVTLPGQIIAGAGAGYVYDIGGNLVQDEFTFTPGGGTIAGALVPPIFSGAARGLGALVTPSPTFGPTAKTVDNLLPPAPARTVVEESTEPVVESGITQKAREIAQTPARLAGRAQDVLQESTERAQVRTQVSPRAQEALDLGLDKETVRFADSFDPETKAIARQIVEAAENPRAGVNPQEIPGEYIVKQYEDFIGPKRKDVGTRIGELSDALPNQSVDMTSQHKVLNNILKENNIDVKNGKLVFNNKRITGGQQKLMQDMYDMVTGDTVLTPRQIHEFDQRITAEYREGVVRDKLGNIFIDYLAENGTKQTAPVDQVFRDVMRKKLLEFGGDIQNANREYMLYKQLESDILNTYLKQSNRLNVEPDLNITAGAALRRVYSNAQSSAEYKAIAEKMDLISRQLGYEGPNPSDLAEFYLRDVKPLYPDSIQPASFEGGIIGGIRGALSSVMDIGRVTESDKKRALKLLLGDEIAGPTPGALDDVPLGMSIKKSVTPESVAKNMDREDYLKMAQIAEDPSVARIDPELSRIVDDMGLNKATNDELESFAKEVLDEYDGVAGREVFNQSATTKTTDLLEEARKYPDAKSFVKAQGAPVYHGTDADFIELTVPQDKVGVDAVGRGIYLTKNTETAKEYGSKIMNVRVAKDTNIVDWDRTPNDEKLIQSITNSLNKNGIKATNRGDGAIVIDSGGFIDFMSPEFSLKRLVRLLNKEDTDLSRQIMLDAGIDGVQFGNNIVVFNPSKVKTETQLTKIWENANN